MPNHLLTVVVAVVLAASGAVGAQPTEELHGAYNFLLEVAGASGAVGGYFMECSGVGSEHELSPTPDASSSTKIPGMRKFANVTLKRGTIATSDLDAWKAKIGQSGLLILSRMDRGRVVCRWELRSPQVLGIRGADVRDGAELSLRASVSGGCS